MYIYIYVCIYVHMALHHIQNIFCQMVGHMFRHANLNAKLIAESSYLGICDPQWPHSLANRNPHTKPTE